MSQLVAFVRNGLSGFLDWWLAELAGLVPRVLHPARRRRRRQLVLAVANGEFSLLRGGGADGRLIGRAASGDSLDGLVRQARARKRQAVLRLAPEHGLRKTIELPLAAKEDLDQLLRFEMDRLTPFRAEEVLFAHRITSTEPRSRRMQVELHLAPKAAVEHALGAAKDAGLVPVRVELGGAGGGADDALDLLPGGRAARGGATRLSRALAVLALLLAAAAVAIPCKAPLDRRRPRGGGRRRQGRGRGEPGAARAARAGQRAHRPSGRREGAGAAGQPDSGRGHARGARPGLSRPPRLARRHAAIGRLRRSGRLLIGLLDRSPLFQTPQFRSPVTPDRRTGLERFHVSLELAAEES